MTEIKRTPEVEKWLQSLQDRTVRAKTGVQIAGFYLQKFGRCELRKAVDEDIHYEHYDHHERISLTLKGLDPVECRTQTP